jgi:hypothetical protein
MKKIIIISSFIALHVTCLGQIDSIGKNFKKPDLTGTWVHIEKGRIETVSFFENGSYKMIVLSSKKNKKDTLIMTGKWNLTKDSLELTEMDRVDEFGKSLMTDPKVIYYRSETLKYFLTNEEFTVISDINGKPQNYIRKK